VDVAAELVEASAPGADGFIDHPNQRISLQHILPISTPADLAQVPIEDTTGKRITLGQVSTVIEDHPALRGDAVPPPAAAPASCWSWRSCPARTRSR